MHHPSKKLAPRSSHHSRIPPTPSPKTANTVGEPKRTKNRQRSLQTAKDRPSQQNVDPFDEQNSTKSPKKIPHLLQRNPNVERAERQPNPSQPEERVNPLEHAPKNS